MINWSMRRTTIKTPWHRHTFPITGPLCGESTGKRGIHDDQWSSSTRASNAGPWFFHLLLASARRWTKSRDAVMLMWLHRNDRKELHQYCLDNGLHDWGRKTRNNIAKNTGSPHFKKVNIEKMFLCDAFAMLRYKFYNDFKNTQRSLNL